MVDLSFSFWDVSELDFGRILRLLKLTNQPPPSPPTSTWVGATTWFFEGLRAQFAGLNLLIITPVLLLSVIAPLLATLYVMLHEDDIPDGRKGDSKGPAKHIKKVTTIRTHMDSASPFEELPVIKELPRVAERAAARTPLRRTRSVRESATETRARTLARRSSID